MHRSRGPNSNFTGGQQLPESVRVEQDLFMARVRDFVRIAVEDGRLDASAEIRARRAVTLVIELFDMIDSIDHRTSKNMGGTREIQDFARQGRDMAREFYARVPETD